MKIKVITGLAILGLIAFSCKSNTPTEPENTNTDTTVTEEVAPVDTTTVSEEPVVAPVEEAKTTPKKKATKTNAEKTIKEEVNKAVNHATTVTSEATRKKGAATEKAATEKVNSAIEEAKKDASSNQVTRQRN